MEPPYGRFLASFTISAVRRSISVLFLLNLSMASFHFSKDARYSGLWRSPEALPYRMRSDPTVSAWS